MIYDRHAQLKYRYGNRKFWFTGYYVDTVGRNKKLVEEYIRNQIQDDVVVLDHIIVNASAEYYSMKEKGYVKDSEGEGLPSSLFLSIYCDNGKH